MESPDLVGVAGVPGQGRHLILYARIVDGRVAEAQFDCHGCGVTIACGSALTELITGRLIGECQAVGTKDLIAAIDGVPPDKGDCPEFAIHALRHLISQMQGGHSNP